MNAAFKGYLLGTVAAATYGMNPLFALPLYEAGMNADSVLFFRYLLAIPLLAAMLCARRGPRSLLLRRHEVVPLVGMGLLTALSSLTLFESYNYMAAGIASTLLFVYPILTALLMALFFGERLSLHTWLCIAVAMGGVGLLYKAEDGSTLSATGTLLAMASALTYAVYLVGVNRTRLRDSATLKVTLYVLFFGLFLFAGRLLAGGGLCVPARWYQWGNLVALAVFPTAISFLCTTTAIRYIGSTPTAILGALEPVTALVIGVLVFDESLTPRDLLGLTLVIGSVTLVIGGGGLSRSLLRIRKLFPRLVRRSR